MAWDTETTRRKLLEAGARQFAAAGLAGARMEQIGRDAGVNKERIYHYFGDKRTFFAAVLAHEVSSLLDGLVLSAPGPEAAGELAGQLFDRCAERPSLARLLAWESLELDSAVTLEHRRSACAGQAARLRSAVPELDQETTEHLLLSIVTLVVSAWTLAPVAESVLSGGLDLAVRRRYLVTQARALAATAGHP